MKHVCLLHLCFTAVVVAERSGVPAKLLGEDRRLRGSHALLWVKVSPDDALPLVHSVTVAPSQYVCRARLTSKDDLGLSNAAKIDHAYHAGVAGPETLWQCRIIVSEQILLKNKFQLLINEESSARLNWMRWQQFQALPDAVVAVNNDDVFVARTEVELDKEWKRLYKVPLKQRDFEETSILALGGLYLKEQYGLIVVSARDEAVLATEGELLVEMSPKKVVLSDFVKGRLRSELHTKIRLGNESLLQNGSYLAKIEGTEHNNKTYLRVNLCLHEWINFDVDHNLAKGAAVEVNFPNRTVVHLRWGQRRVQHQIRQVRIGYVQPLKEENVRLVLTATEIQRRFEYRATLQSHYEDGSIYMRPVQGVYSVTVVDNIRSVFERMPTQSTTGSTTTTISTTMTTKAVMKRETTLATFFSDEDSSMSKSYRFPLLESSNAQINEDNSKESFSSNANNSFFPYSKIFYLQWFEKNSKDKFTT